MKKLLLCAVALLGVAFQAEAQTLSVSGNEFYALKGGDATLAVNVGSATDVRDVQFNIVLPEGVEVGTPTTDNTDYAVEMSTGTPVTGGNQYTVILYSATAAKGAGTVNFPITVPETFTGELWANLASETASVVGTNDAAAEAAGSSTAYTFQVGLLGDVNKDKAVDSGDAQRIQTKYLGGTPDVFVEAVADINKDGTVDSADSQQAIVIYNSGI